MSTSVTIDSSAILTLLQYLQAKCKLCRDPSWLYWFSNNKTLAIYAITFQRH